MVDDDLLANIKRDMAKLSSLLEQCNDHWCQEDLVYRFYHHSFKAYWYQSDTLRVVKALGELAPDGCELNADFMRIVDAGTRKVFVLEHNTRWLEETRPIVEAFMHARFFLEMVVKYGNELEQAPTLLPSGWALVLYLYNLR